MFHERAWYWKVLKMNAPHSHASSALFGSEEYLSVSRAVSELHAGRPVRVDAPGEVLLALPVESLDDRRLLEFAGLCSPNALELILTSQRARVIGIELSAAIALPLSAETNTSDIFALAADDSRKNSILD